MPKLPPSSHSSKTLVFNKQIECTRYDAIFAFPYIPGKYLYLEKLHALGIREEVVALIDGNGWNTFFHLRMPVFIELVHEFYCTFFFDKSAMLTVHTPDIVSFRLLGHRFYMSMAEFNSALGFDPQVLTCDFPSDFDAAIAYYELCDNPHDVYYPNKSKRLIFAQSIFEILA